MFYKKNLCHKLLLSIFEKLLISQNVHYELELPL